jgi:hypothetical protein
LELKGKAMNVYQKLNEARERFHTAPIKKSGLNKFAGYKYFELGDFVIPALQIFKEVGLTSVIRFGTDQAVMEIVNNEKPDEKIIFSSPMSTAALKGCHEVQNLGAVQTYIRRYLWVAALEIVEHDALDATTGKKGDGPVITPKGDIGNDIPEEEKEFLIEMAASCEDLVSQGKAKDAKLMVDSAQLEADQKVWLWGQLSSTTRSAIKKAGN